MTDSILTSTKKILGIDANYTAFDLDVMTHINAAFSSLAQLGVGPVDGFMIEDERATWDDFVVPMRHLNMVKTYIYLKVRLIFDPPATSFHLEAMKEQIQEFEWRLNTAREYDTFPLVVVEVVSE